MDRATKNLLQFYWNREDDDEVEIHEELLDDEDDDSIKYDDIDEVFSIDIDVFAYETPLCKEFNYFF